MNHIRSLYGRFFLRIMAVCFLLAGLLFVAAASIREGNSQLSVCLILIAATVLLLFSAILLAVLIRAVRPRNSSENSQNETRLSFLTDLLNDEHLQEGLTKLKETQSIYREDSQLLWWMLSKWSNVLNSWQRFPGRYRRSPPESCRCDSPAGQ